MAADALNTWCHAVENGQTPPTIAVSYEDFRGHKVDGVYISRKMLVANYRALMQPELQPIDEGRPIRFVCNQIRSADMPRGDVQALIGDANYAAKHELEFCVYMFGSLIDGRALTVRLRGFEPFFDVRCPDNLSHSEFESRIAGFIGSARVRGVGIPVKHRWFEAFTADGWTQHPRRVLRLSSPALRALKATYDLIHKAGYTTYNNAVDSVKTYYRSFLRETGLHLGEVIEVAGYTHYSYDNMSKLYDGAILHIDVPYESVRNVPNASIYRDPSLYMSWDIETYDPSSNEVPEYSNDRASISLICCDLSWHWSKKPIFYVALTPRDVDVAQFIAKHPARPTLIVRCKDQADMLKMHCMLIRRFQPSFISGFNDSGYDWPWIIDRVHKTEIQAGQHGTKPYLDHYYQQCCYSECGRVPKKAASQILTDFNNMRTVKIGPTALPRQCSYLQTDGFVCVDMQIMMLKRDERAEITAAMSMNYFAQTILKIAKKADLWEHSPVPTFVASQDTHGEARRILSLHDQRIASGGDNTDETDFDRDRMTDFVVYCIIDSEICKLMAIEVGLIDTHRALAMKSHISLADSMWLANGAKVMGSAVYNGRVLFGAAHGAPLLYNLQAEKFDEDAPRVKISGAYVVSPEYGLERLRPVAGLDIQSLYPSVIVQYNIDHSQMIVVERDNSFDYRAMLGDVEKLGWGNVNQIDVSYDGRDYTFFTVKHRGVKASMGNIPLILETYMAERSVLKDWANHLKEYVDGLSLELATDESFERFRSHSEVKYATVGACEHEANRVKLHARIVEMRGRRVEISGAIQFLAFEAMNAKIEQEALKLLMNVFYGASAARFLALYNLYLSSAVTAIGQRIIKSLHAEAIRMGFDLKYGDTDSMYVCRASDYEPYVEQQALMYGRDVAVGAAVAEGQLERAEYEGALRESHRIYYDWVIRHSIADMKELNAHLNRFLMEMHEGSVTIVIKYEEVLMPMFCLAKKMYAGMKHVAVPVLHKRLERLPKDDFDKLMLVKGFDMVKQGVARMTTDSTMRMLTKLLDPLSMESLCWTEPWRVVNDEIRYLVEHENWNDHARFAKAKTYRRDKQNIPVQEFVARLRMRSDPEVPANGEKFFFVIVRTNKPMFNIYGRKQTESVGERMELLSVAKAQGLEIDKRYYLEKQINNTLCKLVAYMFDDEDEEDDADNFKKMGSAATRYIAEQIGLCLNEPKISHIDARHFMQDLVEGASEQMMHILHSTFSEKKSGIFRAHANTPIMLAGYEPSQIIEEVHNSYAAVQSWFLMPASNGRDEAALLEALTAMMGDVRLAYGSLQRAIIDWRTSGRPTTEFVLDGGVAATITGFLTLLDEIAAHNLSDTIRLARASYVRALEIR